MCPVMSYSDFFQNEGWPASACDWKRFVWTWPNRWWIATARGLPQISWIRSSRWVNCNFSLIREKYKLTSKKRYWISFCLMTEVEEMIYFCILLGLNSINCLLMKYAYVLHRLFGGDWCSASFWLCSFQGWKKYYNTVSIRKLSLGCCR